MIPCISETALASFFAGEGDAYLAAHCTSGLAGAAPNSLYYELYRADAQTTAQKNPLHTAKGMLVLCHGFSESAAKYRELIYYVLQEGYHVLCYDARGHGHSFREVPGFSKIHIDDFDDYVRDLNLLLTQVLTPEFAGLPLHLYGHSMGGCVAVRYLETHPERFRSCILSSPMIGVATGGIPAGLAAGIARIQKWCGNGKGYVPGHHDFRPGESFDSSASSSEARFQLYQALRQTIPLLQNSGADYCWLAAALKGSKKARKPEQVRRIQVPILLLEADCDHFVNVKTYPRFRRQLQDVEYHKLPGTRHELYSSPDSILQQYYNWIFDFLDRC